MHVWLYAIVTLQYNCSLGRHWLLIVAVIVPGHCLSCVSLEVWKWERKKKLTSKYKAIPAPFAGGLVTKDGKGDVGQTYLPSDSRGCHEDDSATRKRQQEDDCKSMSVETAADLQTTRPTSAMA